MVCLQLHSYHKHVILFHEIDAPKELVEEIKLIKLSKAAASLLFVISAPAINSCEVPSLEYMP